MTTTWYRTSTYGRLIEPVEATKVTKSSIWYREPLWDGRLSPIIRRRTMFCGHHGHYQTWEEAKEALVKDAEQNVESARRHLEMANSRLGNLKGLKPDMQKV
jgi:hypothetical protein